jgi:hypothetical protein
MKFNDICRRASAFFAGVAEMASDRLACRRGRCRMETLAVKPVRLAAGVQVWEIKKCPCCLKGRVEVSMLGSMGDGPVAVKDVGDAVEAVRKVSEGEASLGADGVRL